MIVLSTTGSHVQQFSVERGVLGQNYSSQLREHLTQYRLVAFVRRSIGIGPGYLTVQIDVSLVSARYFVGCD